MKSGRKIVRLFSRLNVGGPAIHVVNLSRGLRSHGYETILAVGQPDAAEGSMENYALEQDVPLHFIPGFQAQISLFRDLRAAIAIFRLIRRERPAIVHTHTFKAGLLGRVAARLNGVPLVVHTYHGHLLHGYWTGWKSKFIVWLERFLNCFTDHVIAVSDRVGEDLIQAGIVKGERLHVVRLGFDVNRFRSQHALPSGLRQRLGIPREDTVVAIVGRLVPVKNVDLFLESLSPLLSKFAGLHLVIVGDGSERVRLEKRATGQERIHFAGFIQPMGPEWKDIDLCVCTSRNEGTSVSVIEAVMAGVPVISTSVGGMPDLLENGLWGRLVSQTPEAIRAAVEEWLVLRDPPPKRASEIFQRKFCNSRLIAETERIYREAEL